MAGTRGDTRARILDTAWELRLWFAYLPEILPVARALEAAAVNGDEGGVAWRDRMADLRVMFAAAVDRVQAVGHTDRVVPSILAEVVGPEA